MIALLMLTPLLHAAPATPCGLQPDQLPGIRITGTRAVPGNDDAWEVMVQVLNWTGRDLTGLRIAVGAASTAIDGGPPRLVGASVDPNGRPFGSGARLPLGNQPMVHPWSMTLQTSTLAIYEGSALPATVWGAASGPYDPAIDATSCAAALTTMIPGGVVSGTDLLVDPNALDDGAHAADGVSFIVDDLDPGEVLSLNWVGLTADGVAGYADEDGVIIGAPLGFGTLELAVFDGGLAPTSVLDGGTGFSPPSAFDPNLDSPFLWVEDEVGGVDGFPVNPIAPWLPGAGTYLAAEAAEYRTGPFAHEADAAVQFEGVDVVMSPNSAAQGQALVLEGPRWVLPGDVVELVVTGAQPGDEIWFVFGRSEGRGRCLPALRGDCLDVRRASPLGQVIADANGQAILSTTVPATAPLDLTVYLQAVAFRGRAHTRTSVLPVSTGYDPSIPCPILGDADGDAVCDDVDVCLGDDLFGDADGDGVCDDLDLCSGDDTLGDADGDGVCDDLDACVGDDTLGDADGDLICDDLDLCAGDDTLGDADGDFVCDDLDLCDGDDTLGDPDGDGICGGVVDPCEGTRGCVEIEATYTRFRIPELRGASFELAIGFQGTHQICYDDGVFGGSSRYGTQPNEQVTHRFTASTPEAQNYLDSLPASAIQAEFYLPFNEVTVEIGSGFVLTVDTQLSYWSCFTHWTGGTLSGTGRDITINQFDTVQGDYLFRYDW